MQRESVSLASGLLPGLRRLPGYLAPLPRTELRSRNIRVLMVKNSTAARATEGTPLAPLFADLAGTAAICWGGEDIVSLAKEITKLVKDDKYKPFEARGGVMDGEALSGPQVEQVSKWPSRTEQLSILLGQILSPAPIWSVSLGSVGGALASQIEQKAKGEEPGESAESEAAPRPRLRPRLRPLLTPA